MKKLFFFAIAVLGMTAACSKPTVEIDDSNEPVAIQFGVKAPTLTVTKTKAAVDDWTGNQVVTIYGYKKGDVSTVLLNGETGTVAASTNPDPDASVADEGSITFTTQPYYEGTTVYDFRAVYTGDATTGEATTGASISQTVTIDGDDDIMHAVTDIDNDKANPTLGEGETAINEARIYSAYAARRNVHPSLVFSHKLTRFAFNVTKGNSSEDALPVKVTNISVKTQNTGTLYIAGTNEGKFEPSGEAVALDVKDFVEITPAESPTPAGEIMVFPVSGADNSIEITLTLSAEGHEVQPMTVNLTPSMVTGNTAFEAGKKYDVTFTVYGLEQIKVTAKLTEWVDGGDAAYDPDKYWEE